MALRGTKQSHDVYSKVYDNHTLTEFFIEKISEHAFALAMKN